VRIGVTVVVTLALTALTIHTIRFLPSPEAAHPFSQVMAILLLAALIAVYPLILKYIWGVWRREEGG
jgi:tellurite resistance protein TehA-like permease